jgi:hypothetical protein
MPDLIELASGYALNDPWTPADPTGIALFTGFAQRLWEIEHVANGGRHNAAFISMASGNVTWNGVNYLVEKGEGLAVPNGGILPRPAQGIVRIQMSFSFAAANEFIIVGDPMDKTFKKLSIWEAQDAAAGGAKTADQASLRIWNRANGYVDASFGFHVYGRR